MFSALEFVDTPTVRKARKRAETQQSEVTTKVLTQAKSDNSEEVQTEEVTRVYKVLKRRFKENSNRPLCFYSFVVNPDSFGLTIENIFHTSFLFRDGHAEMSHDQHGLPLISPRARESSTSTKNHESNQAIISLCMDEWKEIVNTFKIKESLIPPPIRDNKRSLAQ